MIINKRMRETAYLYQIPKNKHTDIVIHIYTHIRVHTKMG